GKLPVAGTSGTVSQPPNPPSGPETAGCSVKVYGGEILANRDFGADTVQIKSEVVCKSANVVYVYAGDFPSALNDVGTYAVSAGEYTSTIFNVDPCWPLGGSDLSGTKVS